MSAIPPVESSELDPALPRRLRWWAGAYGFGAAALWLAGGRDPLGAFFLTLTAVLSIVSLSGTEALVRRIVPGSNGRLGLLQSLALVSRFLLVLVAVIVVFEMTAERYWLALALGFFAMPAALLTESVKQVLGTRA